MFRGEGKKRYKERISVNPGLEYVQLDAIRESQCVFRVGN